MYGVSDQMEEKYQDFAAMLPHGSGIDDSWSLVESRNFLYFRNSFHIMDQYGFYRYWQDFTVKIAKADFEAGNWQKIANTFTLQFNNGQRYLTRVIDLRSYLVDTIAYAISEI